MFQLQLNKGIDLRSSSESSDCSQQGEPVKKVIARSKHTRSKKEVDAAVIMTSLKTVSPKLNDGKEQDDNRMHFEETSILSFCGAGEDSSLDLDQPDPEDNELGEMIADLTEDENEQLVSRTSISKKEDKRRPVENNEQHYESPAHLTRKKAKAAGILVSKDGTRTRTEDTWV